MTHEPLCSSRRSFVLAVLLAVFTVPGSVLGTDHSPSPRGALDGLSFVGTLRSADKTSGRDDVLYFGDGQFWSKNCVPCGFQPGAYYVRHVGGSIEFQGVLESQDRGRFHYTGIVRDGRIDVHINWRKNRWYWTINKDFRFEGDLAEGIEVSSAERASRVALSSDPEPEDCPL